MLWRPDINFTRRTSRLLSRDERELLDQMASALYELSEIEEPLKRLLARSKEEQVASGERQHYAKLTSATQDGSNYRWTYAAVRATIDKDASGITASDFDDTTEEIEVHNWLEVYSSTSLYLNSPTGNSTILPLTNLSAGDVYVPIVFTGQTNSSDKRIAWCSIPNPYECPAE